MKSILISIKPKYVADILNGKKTIEIRKTKPNVDLPIDVYIYCTKGKEKLFYSPREKRYKTNCFSKSFRDLNKNNPNIFNGKVVAKFTLNKVEEVFDDEDSTCWFTDTLNKPLQLQRKSCLDYVDISNYFNGNIGYAWHISNLVIFDKPKELSEFKTLKRAKATDCFVCDVYQLTEMCIGNRCLLPKPLTKAPQSWCYVEE